MKIITTDYKNNKFWEEQEVKKQEISCMEAVRVFPEIQRQEVKGFGGAFTESAAYCYKNLQKEAREEFLEAYFGEKGLRYNIGRTHINSCDFSLGNYTADDDEEDTEFQKFSLNREEEYIFPLIREAQEKKQKKIPLLLSPWSPPAYMKTNGDMNHGGFLKESYYETWARYLVKYVQEIREKGFETPWMSVQNEPDAVQTWDSCRYTPVQEGTFAGKFLGPELERQGLKDIDIFIWDHNKECAYDRVIQVLEQENADKYVKGVGVHWYTGDHFENVKLIKEAFPEKEVFFTEGCVEYSRFERENEVYKAEMYAHDMAGNFRNGISAFLDWNLLLDAEGGPNHVGNYCDAPILCKEGFQGIEKHLSYYYIGHFSRYVKQGARVIPVSSYCMEAEGAAFVNLDGEKVLVLLNRQNQVLRVNAGEKGEGVHLELQPHSISTVIWK